MKTCTSTTVEGEQPWIQSGENDCDEDLDSIDSQELYRNRPVQTATETPNEESISLDSNKLYRQRPNEPTTRGEPKFWVKFEQGKIDVLDGKEDVSPRMKSGKSFSARTLFLFAIIAMASSILSSVFGFKYMKIKEENHRLESLLKEHNLKFQTETAESEERIAELKDEVHSLRQQLEGLKEDIQTEKRVSHKLKEDFGAVVQSINPMRLQEIMFGFVKQGKKHAMTVMVDNFWNIMDSESIQVILLKIYGLHTFFFFFIPSCNGYCIVIKW